MGNLNWRPSNSNIEQQITQARKEIRDACTRGDLTITEISRRIGIANKHIDLCLDQLLQRGYGNVRRDNS